MKKIDRIFLIMSSYSGLIKLIANKRKGSKVVFKKKLPQFLNSFNDNYPVRVYLPSH